MNNPSERDVEGLRGTVNRGTSGIAVGSVVELERQGGGWHLFVTALDEAHQATAWDIWCDTWSDAEQWFVDWSITWHGAPSNLL